MLQNNASFCIPSNTEPNPKREGKEHAKAITFRSGAVVKNPIRSMSGEEDAEKEKSTCTPSVGDGVGERIEAKVEPKQPEPFSSHLEERKKENEEFLSFLNMFKAFNVNLPLL